MADSETTLLLDGNSLVYRAFYAVPQDMATSSGVLTGAVYGFTSMLIQLLRGQNPARVAVCFDRPEPTFRHERESGYKANRTGTPDELIGQMGLVRDVLSSIGIPSADLAGFEADDLLATLARQAEGRGEPVVIVSGDRDIYQLVKDPLIKVMYNRRGVSDYVLFDEAGIKERVGLPPSMYVQYAALRGDPSDNLPGVPGVGEKTASRLLAKYGDIESLLAAASEQTPKLAANLEEHADAVRRNILLMTLRDDAPLSIGPSEMEFGEVDYDEVGRVFSDLEFDSLRRKLQVTLQSRYQARISEDDPF